MENEGGWGGVISSYVVLQSKRGKLLKFFINYIVKPLSLYLQVNNINCYLHVNGLHCEFQLLYIHCDITDVMS